MLPGFQAGRVAVLGIGNELNGDDAAGVLVARALKAEISRRPGKEGGLTPADLLVIDAGTAPENFTGPLRRFQPDLVILVDAAELEKQPGDFAWIDWQAVDGFSGSTHLLPPSVFARFLVQEIGCQMAFIGIQPASLGFGLTLSKPVLQAVSKITRQLVELLKI